MSIILVGNDDVKVPIAINDATKLSYIKSILEPIPPEEQEGSVFPVPYANQTILVIIKKFVEGNLTPFLHELEPMQLINLMKSVNYLDPAAESQVLEKVAKHVDKQIIDKNYQQLQDYFGKNLQLTQQEEEKFIKQLNKKSPDLLTF